MSLVPNNFGGYDWSFVKTFGEIGLHKMFLKIVDKAGHIKIIESPNTIFIDIDKPTCSIASLDTVIDVGLLDIEIIASDVSTAIDGYYVAMNNSVEPSLNQFISIKPTAVTLEFLGSNTIYAWVKDKAGNISDPATKTVNVLNPDITPPTVIFLLPSYVSKTIITEADGLSIQVTDNSTGSFEYMITSTNVQDGIWATEKPTSIVLQDIEGSQTIYLHVKDSNGNIASVFSTIFIDKTAPILNVTTPATSFIMNLDNFTMSGTASDIGGSGIKKITFYLLKTGDTIELEQVIEFLNTNIISSRAGNINWTVNFTNLVESTYTISYMAEDLSGLQSNKITLPIQLVMDITPPEIDGFSLGAPT